MTLEERHEKLLDANPFAIAQSVSACSAKLGISIIKYNAVIDPLALLQYTIEFIPLLTLCPRRVRF